MPNKRFGWDEEKTTILLQEYIKRPILWERKFYGQSVQGLKEKAWKSIAEILYENVYNCKSRMNCLFTRYRYMTSKGATDRDSREKETWFAFKYLKELQDRKHHRSNENANKSDDEESDGCSSSSKDNHEELPLVEQPLETDAGKKPETIQPLETDAGKEPETIQQGSGDVLIKMEIIDIDDNPIEPTSKSDPVKLTKPYESRLKRKLSCDNNESSQIEPETSATQLINLNDIIRVQNQMEKEINEFTNFLTSKFQTYSLVQFREVEGKIRKILLEADENWK